MGGFRKGGSCDSRFILQPDVAIANEVSLSSKNSLAITDFLAKTTQLVNYCGNPLPGTSPFTIPNSLFLHSLTGKDGSGPGFGSWKMVLAVPVPLSVSGKTVPTVPLSGSGSVPEPPWKTSVPIRLVSWRKAVSAGKKTPVPLIKKHYWLQELK